MKKKKNFFVGIIILVIGFFALFAILNPQEASSQYNHSTSDMRISLSASFSENQKEINWKAVNNTSNPIDYAGYCCLERETQTGWVEILTRTGARQEEISRTAELHFIPSNAEIIGMLPLNVFSRLSPGTYRVVLPLVDSSQVVISNSFTLSD